jgi:hypothetical protein
MGQLTSNIAMQSRKSTSEALPGAQKRGPVEIPMDSGWAVVNS